MPEGQKAYSMTKPIRMEHLQGCIDWWGGKERKGRKETPQAWHVKAEDVKARGYNLDINGFTRPMPHEKDGIPIVTGKNVKCGVINFETAHRTPKEAYEALTTTKTAPCVATSWSQKMVLLDALP